MYTYRAKILKVIDGNTLELLVNLGMNFWTRQRIRMSDVITAYLWSYNDREQIEAQRAKEFLENALELPLQRKATFIEHLKEFDVIIKTKKEGNFGRFIAEVEIIGDGCTLGDRLKKAGLEIKKDYGS